jgi:hypothetical protein
MTRRDWHRNGSVVRLNGSRTLHQHISSAGQSTSGIRRGPRLADNFTIVSNAVVNDESLSFRARAVLIWLLSKPADWRTRSESIAEASPKEGREAIRTAMRELEQQGYLVREKIQNERGQWVTIQTVYEEPVTSVDPSPEPGPRKSGSGKANPGELGANQRIDHKGRKQTTTQPATKAPVERVQAARPVVVGKSSDERLHDLAAACHDKGLIARWDAIGSDKADAIAALVEVHGVQALADHALKMHTPLNPTRFAGGYLGIWQTLPAPRAAAAPKCGDCDEYGWRGEDSEGRPIRCSCRRTPASAAA